MLQAEWLPSIAQDSFNEIVVADGASLHLLHANNAASLNLQYSYLELITKALPDIVAEVDQANLLERLRSATNTESTPILMNANMVRHDGSHYLAEMRCIFNQAGTKPVWIIIARDISIQHEAASELGVSKSLFRGIVSNTPGLVYQFQLSAAGKPLFTYLSEGCQALLGLPAEQLCKDPELFVDLILPDDRPSYLNSMASSSQDMKSWNWEGRIWIEAWKDIKWINLRATPHLLPDESVQWNGIMSNITQSKLEQFEIKHSRTRLAELSAHVEQVKEQQRTQIAREVHDDLGGNLTAIKMALALLANRLPADNKELAEKTAYLDSLVDRTIESAHRIASDLRPSILDLGIVAALEWQTGEFEKQVGIPCSFSSTTKDIDLPPDQATAIFRIFQETLTNIAKHAGATRVTVKLTLSKGNISLKIIDNGKGMSSAERLKPQSFGIRGMIERAHALGGKLNIVPTEGGGCTVKIKVPQA